MTMQKKNLDISSAMSKLSQRLRPLRAMIIAGPTTFLALVSLNAIISIAVTHDKNYLTKISNDLIEFEKKGPQSEIKLAQYNGHKIKDGSETAITKLTTKYSNQKNQKEEGKEQTTNNKTVDSSANNVGTVADAFANNINNMFDNMRTILLLMSVFTIIVMGGMAFSGRIHYAKFFSISCAFLMINIATMVIKTMTIDSNNSSSTANQTENNTLTDADPLREIMEKTIFNYEKVPLISDNLNHRKQNEISDADIQKMDKDYRRIQSYSDTAISQYASEHTPSFTTISRDENLRSGTNEKPPSENNIFTIIKINFYYQWLILNHFQITDSSDVLKKNLHDLIKSLPENIYGQTPDTLFNLYRDGGKNLLSWSEIEKNYPEDIKILQASKQDAEKYFLRAKNAQTYSHDAIFIGLIALMASISLIPSYVSIRKFSRQSNSKKLEILHEPSAGTKPNAA